MLGSHVRLISLLNECLVDFSLEDNTVNSDTEHMKEELPKSSLSCLKSLQLHFGTQNDAQKSKQTLTKSIDLCRSMALLCRRRNGSLFLLRIDCVVFYETASVYYPFARQAS